MKQLKVISFTYLCMTITKFTWFREIHLASATASYPGRPSGGAGAYPSDNTDSLEVGVGGV